MKDHVRRMASHRALALSLFAALLLAAPGAVARADFQILHRFDGYLDGGMPIGSFLQVGSTLYGTTTEAGINGGGTIFKIGTDGSAFSVLYSLSSGDGFHSGDALIQSGSTFYGTTEAGGTHNDGTIFKIGSDGSGFSLLHTFAGGSNDGIRSYGSLLQVGSNLYGMTSVGGTQNHGTIFEIGSDGSNFSILHSFATATGGVDPRAPLIQIGSNLYGVFSNTAFKMGLDGSGFTVLHSFVGGANDGLNPVGSLIQIGSTFYGVTQMGGSDNIGTVFKMGQDGSGFSLLHSFSISSGAGQWPSESLVYANSMLYGMTNRGGGTGSSGTIFGIATDGSGFSLLHSFTGGTSDGSVPFGYLTASNETLYGMTYEGGDGIGPGDGTIFSLTVPEPSSLMLAFVGAIALSCSAWRTRRRRKL